MTLTKEAIDTSANLAETIERNERSEADVEPGVYEALEFERYLRIPAASNTALSWLRRSPAHLRAYIEEPPTFVDPDSVGRAFHALVLEGEAAFRARYAKGEGDNRSLAYWKKKARDPKTNAWLDDDGRVLLREVDWRAVYAMAERVFDHPAAALALEGATLHEVSLVWDDEDTGVRMKARPDALNPTIAAVIDFKSSKDASRRAFERAIYDYSYYMQGSIYQDGASALTGDRYLHHVIIAQEKTPPYAVAVYRLQNDILKAGRDEYRQLLDLYRECVENDSWSGYDETFQDISVPPWAWGRIEREVYQ